MFAFHELSEAARIRRQEMGLSQGRLAQLAGLPRAPIYQLERQTIKDPSLTLAAAVLKVLGLRLAVTPAHPRLHPKVSSEDPLDVAARTASTSYAGVVPSEAVADALRTGCVPAEFGARVHALLDEAPIALLARAVEQVLLDSNIAREEIWANMRKIAQLLKSRRDIWAQDC